jgi:cytochrome c biogenesis protein CcmG, thiol:disulfide interchange protein DsbE
MSRYVLWSIGALALGVAFFILEPFFASPAARSNGPASWVGEQAPVFQLRDDRGVPVSLERYRGQIVLMNLWASWCPPCRAEMPDLQRLAHDYERDGIRIIGVNEGESPQRAAAFADSLGIHFPIWIDTAQRYGRTYTALGLPTTVILDPRGVVVRAFDGALTFVQMQSAVRPLVRMH